MRIDYLSSHESKDELRLGAKKKQRKPVAEGIAIK